MAKPRFSKSFEAVSSISEASEHIKGSEEKVYHPLHYGGDTPYEAIKVIEAWGFDTCFYTGNVLKYIRRSSKCNPITAEMELLNLQKARWYLNRRIASLLVEAESET